MEKIKALMQDIRRTGEKAHLEDAIHFYMETIDKMWTMMKAGTACALHNINAHDIETILKEEEDVIEFISEDLEELGATYIRVSEMLRYVKQILSNPDRYEAYTKAVEDKIIYCIYDKESGLLVKDDRNKSLYT